ncbi:MAG: DUF1080 domain-containing protein [Candidatus Anammoximicrobium sp.]|nr:DUF1080 domain-containing protein [Candidatus Anammoximicrobium sp.]
MSLAFIFSGLLVLAGQVDELVAAQVDRARMVIDENFPASDEARAIGGFRAYGGTWRVENGVLYAPAGPGPKLVAESLALTRGEVGVEVLLPDAAPGNAGLIVKLSEPGVGADSFHGYEVALDTAGYLRLGRHRQNFKPIRDVPCAVPVKRWIALVVCLTETTLEIVVDGKTMLVHEDREHPLTGGGVAFRPWQREARYRNLWISTGGKKQALPLEPAGVQTEICAPWTAACRGSARGEFSIADGPDPKRRAQRITFLDGEGEVGIAHGGVDGRGLLCQPCLKCDGTRPQNAPRRFPTAGGALLVWHGSLARRRKRKTKRTGIDCGKHGFTAPPVQRVRFSGTRRRRGRWARLSVTGRFKTGHLWPLQNPQVNGC